MNIIMKKKDYLQFIKWVQNLIERKKNSGENSIPFRYCLSKKKLNFDIFFENSISYAID